MNKAYMFGLFFTPVSLNEAAELVIDDASKGALKTVVTPNIEHVLKGRDKDSLRKLFNGFNYQFVDSMPLVWMSRWLTEKTFPERVTGIDLFQRCSQLAAKRGVTVFLLGASEVVLKETVEKLQDEFPGINIVASYSPPHGFEENPAENQQVIDLLLEANAQVIFLALGTPKQEQWIADNLHSFNQGIFLGIGASFDMYSGKFPRAPKWLRKTGCEWLWRLTLEPGRLWRRYARNLLILPYFLREMILPKKADSFRGVDKN